MADRVSRKKQLIDESKFINYREYEHDSCGIVAVIEKNGQPTYENISKTVSALIKMEHRSGFIDGEGDGCGLLTDIPRDLWAEKLKKHRLDGHIVHEKAFLVSHIFIPQKGGESVETIQSVIRQMMADHGIRILMEESNEVNSSVLGKNGRADEPAFWQVAALLEKEVPSISAHLFELMVQIEKRFNVHVASLSNTTASYKLMGAANLLPEYFHDLRNPSFSSSVTIGHNRYSTNTLSNFFRVQPFSILGHNGEINTIAKLREEALMMGVPLVDGGSDSQDMNRTIETFLNRYRLSLFEVMEMIFPPIINEMKLYPDHLKELYLYLRGAWGPFAQGPAGIVSRFENECVFSVDAMGLRPLWMVETDETLYFSSEQGIELAHEMVNEPKPIAPGEKVGVALTPGHPVRIIPYDQLQEIVYERITGRLAYNKGCILGERLAIDCRQEAFGEFTTPSASDQLFSANGWEREHIQLAQQMAANGAEPIRSIGYDGPLAVLSKIRQNITDYMKESVAVVTNPAIDREREIEHFSTRTVLGGRPLFGQDAEGFISMEMPSPILLEGEALREAAINQNAYLLEEVCSYFRQHDAQSVAVLDTVFADGTALKEQLDALARAAAQAVKNGTRLLILDDAKAHENGMLWIDPALVLSKIDQSLKTEGTANDNLRRHVSIILRSGALRNLHDIALAFGLGADAVSPYLLFAAVKENGSTTGVENLFSALNKGLEKVISTIGIHELRGYGRLFSAIGLSDEVADILHVVNYCGGEQTGLTFEKLEKEAKARYISYHSEKERLPMSFRIFPRLWKAITQVADGTIPYDEYAEKLEETERESPISLRHLMDINVTTGLTPLSPEEVDISVGQHDLPLVISSMSFGSQNEIAFRAYAEAAERLNMVSLNGEGGEIKDMLGKYPNTRGHQIASGRFGVNIELCNSANLLEIKIGQGAKPGEGGHLPSSKVTDKIAEARNASKGTDLISPSNNHDIYSIEDLAQMIAELKTANNRAKVSVKVPVVPGIGTIAIGIAKAGADIIQLSGFDGGTGAARAHALQHVGLPIEIGVKAAHAALIEAGLRHKVEIWADGGMKSALDVVKMMLLGANRAGFGSLSMIAIGCTACRGCHLDTCHVGIATQIESAAEAEAKGLKRFVPREYDRAVDNLVTFYSELGQAIRIISAKLGFKRAQDMVGRSDLLLQVRGLDLVNLADMLRPMEMPEEMAAAVTEERMPVLVAAGAEIQSAFEVPAVISAPYHQSYARIDNAQRVLGSRFSGSRVQDHLDGSYRQLPPVKLSFTDGSIPGNGLAAYNADGVNIRVQGGAQDGVGKTSFGGRISILKAPNKYNRYINGSVGKSFAYGAQKGLFLIQGNADSRFCIRLSGADVVLGGEVTEPIRDDRGSIGARANIKGFAFEYMTNGRAVVLGDPGPWICSGMSGGVVYLRVQPEMGLTQEALQRRLAKGARVKLMPLHEKGKKDIAELLGAYCEELEATEQHAKAEQIRNLIAEPDKHFIRVVPDALQSDPNISTE